MTTRTFASFLDRSRLDRLDQMAAELILDMLKTFENRDNEVHQAFLNAGNGIYSRQYRSPTAFQDFVLAETERLLKIVRTQDGAWDGEPGPIQREIDAAQDKVAASIEEIQAEVLALSTRFEDMSYQPVEIGRALARVGLAFAPIGFIAIENSVLSELREGRDDRLRALLDEHLGEDRYPATRARTVAH
ncbi:MAG: hypothetical protein EOM22_05265 [Gammaproteobacteria bacterium]|nr:hypothetical protein [Gammaproteobacteria bacterium]